MVPRAYVFTYPRGGLISLPLPAPNLSLENLCLYLPTLFPSGFQSLYGPNRPLPHTLSAMGSLRAAPLSVLLSELIPRDYCRRNF